MAFFFDKQMNNNIDTIKMVRTIREKQYEEIKNKSHEEIIEYFRKKSKNVNKNLTDNLT